MKLRYVIPLAVFFVLVALLGAQLWLNIEDPQHSREVPSPLIDKPAPQFTLSQLHDPGKTLSTADLRGQVWMLNVWASWCVSCRAEHPLLIEMARQGLVPIYGLNYKDRREDAVQWLRDLGNPYLISAYDVDGRVGMDYGVYGVPETYVIDKEGVIRFKQIGPVTPDVLKEQILPLISRLRG